jgi:GNAT superfamily N-acetyltransferase
LIRAGCSLDVPRLVEMGRRFRASTDYHRHLTENPGKMAELAEQLCVLGGLLVSEREGQLVGMFGYVLFPHFLSGEVIAGEVFWWVEPEHRGEGLKLLRAAEKRAKEAGAQRMQMIAPTDQVGAVYERCGYEFVESAYQKTL